MNKKAMRDLIEKVKLIPPKHFNMETFINGRKLPSEITKDLLRVWKRKRAGNCGSTGCVIGFLPAFYPRRFSYTYGGIIAKKNTDLCGFAAIADLLQITLYQADYLFDPSYYPEDNVTKPVVIKRLKDVLKNGFPAGVGYEDEN